MVARNAAFDVGMLIIEGIEPKNAVCTLKLARFLDKEGVIPHFDLQYLRYYLGIRIKRLRIQLWAAFWSWKASLTEFMPKAAAEFGDDAVAKLTEVSNNPVLFDRYLKLCKTTF